MGKGKWILGGLCALGAIVAAPVVAPVAGMAMLGSTSAAVGTAGIGLLTASSTTVAAGAGLAAGAAGVAAGSAREKRDRKKYDEGWDDGAEYTADVYETKIEAMQSHYQKLLNDYEECKKYKNACDDLIELNDKKDALLQQMIAYNKELEKTIAELKQNKEENEQEILLLQDYRKKIKYRVDKLSA